jgi:hypothetical protein
MYCWHEFGCRRHTLMFLCWVVYQGAIKMKTFEVI